MVALSILLGVLLTSLTALAIGRVVLRRIPVELYRHEEDALAFVAGAGILSLIVFALCAAGAVSKGTLLAVSGTAFGAAWYTGAWRNTRPDFARLPRRWAMVFWVGFTVFTVLYFFSSMAPEFSSDGTAYHLSFVARYAREGGFVRIPWNLYSHLSQGIELLYLMAFEFGRHSAAAMVHYAFLLALTLAIVSYGRRAGYPVVGLAGALLVYASPVVGMDGTTAYIDVAVAAILFAVFYALQIWDEQRSAGLLIVIGILAGFGYAAKYTAGLAIPYAAGFVLWRARRLRPALLVAACAMVLVLPWVVKNLLWTGNPVAPMFNRLFVNPWVHVSFEEGWSTYLRRYYLQNRWTIPLEVTLRGEALCGFLGPAFLLVPVGLFALRIREGRRVLAAGALFALPYCLNIGTRFLIPAAPFFAFALGMALSEMPILLATLLIGHLILSWPAVAVHYTAEHPWILGRILFKQALRIESPDSWLGRKQPEYAIPKMLEAKMPPGSRVLTFSGVAESYTTRDVSVSFQSAEGEVAGDIFFTAFLGDFQPRCAERLPFPPVSLRKLRIIQTAKPVEALQWNVGEVRLYSGGQELRRNPQWKLTAHPNRWGIQLAFDNSPVTRWRSWQRFEPGMYIEVDFGMDQQVDAVQLEGPYDCVAHGERIEGMGAGGKWTALTDQRTIAALSPRSFMGKAAMRELKLRGYDFLFIRKGEFGWAEVAENPDAWGLQEVGQANEGRLYLLAAGVPEVEPQ